MKKIYRLLPVGVLAFMMMLALSPMASADGGAPNLAYVAGTAQGISIVDIAQQKVTGTFSIHGDPHTVALSLDGRFLYVTQPAEGKVAMIAARTGATICTTSVPGSPTLLALDTGTNTVYAAGNGSAQVTGIDATNCKVTSTFNVKGSIHGLAIAFVGNGASNGNQVWIADDTSLAIVDSNTGRQLKRIPINGGPEYISIPSGPTVYVTTRQGKVDAIDLNSYHVTPLFSGGKFGPMDYDAATGNVYVPDMQNSQLDVLNPIGAGETTVPHEPVHIYHMATPPQSIAITSDGQLGFAALSNGDVVMLDIPGQQLVKTIHVGGNPHFIITGLYPPLVGTTPQQASIWGNVASIAAYVFIIALFIVPILLFRRYSRANVKEEEKSGKNGKAKL